MEKIKIDILLMEYDNIWKRIDNCSKLTEKVIGIGIAIISAGLVWGIKENNYFVIVSLPIAFIGVLFYGIDTATETISLGGYKKYLEEILNEILGKDFLCWETAIAMHRHFGLDRTNLYSIYGIFLFTIITISLITAFRHYPLYIFILISIIIFILLIFLFISLLEKHRIFNKSYNIAIVNFNNKR